MFTRIRYQQGCLTKERRKSGPDVWVFLWRELDTEGKRRQRKTVVGSVEEYRTESAAQRAVGALRVEINKETRAGAVRPLTVEQLVSHYEAKELQGERCNKSYSTRAAYKSYLNLWIVPRWKSYLLVEVMPVAVEDWLASLQLARGTKAKIRNIMSAIFSHAKRYRFISENPIEDVRQSAKRERIPDVLTVEELKALLSELQQPFLAMVALDAATGLRRSELLGLKWCDVDFKRSEINLTRAVVHQVVGGMKTEASQKPVSMESELAALMKDWKDRTSYNEPEDWVFASPETKGKRPFWPENIMRRHIRPAAERCGIKKRIGFHTFRHTLATVLKANGEDVKTVQEILRHANSRITLDIYTQAVTPAKRQAQSKLLQMILPVRTGTAEAVNR